MVAVFRGPAPSCEIEFMFRTRGRPGANRVPASTLVRKGYIESGVYAVRVLAVRGGRSSKVGDVVVAVGPLQVRRLEQERHPCGISAARGLIAAFSAVLGGRPPSLSDREREADGPGPAGGVAAAPEPELPPSPIPADEPPGLPLALVVGALAIFLLALGGATVAAIRTVRSSS